MAKKWPDLNFFELAAGADAVQVAVNKKAEQNTGVVCRPAIFLKIDNQIEITFIIERFS